MSSPALAGASPFDLEQLFRRATQSYWLTVAIVAVAMLQQALGHVNCDTSWFITFAEKVLAGAKPYSDISDPNPPAAFLAYAPAVVLAHGLGVAAEAVVVAWTFLGAVASLFVSGAILKRAGLLQRHEIMPMMAAASFVLLLVPAFCFTEREHLALILLLPMLALCAVRASGLRPALWQVALAGLAAGLCLTFKPYYLLPFALAVLCVPVLRRDARLLAAPEIVVAGAIAAAYALAVVLVFPDYVSAALPLIRDVYLPAREGLWEVLTTPAFLANAAVLSGLVYAARGRLKDPRVLIFCAASTGFMATYLIQSKGWINHAYPGTALALLAASLYLLDGPLQRDIGAPRQRQFGLFVFLPLLLAAPLVFGAGAAFGNTEEHPGLKAEVVRFAPPHPKIAALSDELSLGHPLVRQLGGTWVGRQNCLWVSYAVRYLLSFGVDEQRRALLLHYKDADEKMFAEDIASGKPDVLLVETPQLETWAQSEAALAPIFTSYHLAGHADAVSIWLREAQN